MRRLGLSIVVSVLVAACGGPSGDSATLRHHGGADGVRELVLYRDGALVRDRRQLAVTPGATVATMLLPPDVGASGIVARLVDGDAEIASLTVGEPTHLPGDRIEVLDHGRSVKGILRMLAVGSLVIEDDSGVRLILDPHHVVREAGGAGGGGGRHVDIELRADRAGSATIEILYVTRKLSWNADYTLVTEGAAGRAELHGALGIDNGTGIAYDDANLILIDTNRPSKVTAFDQAAPDEPTTGKAAAKLPVADPTKPRAEQPVKPVKPVETPRTVLPFTVNVQPGTQSVSLLDGIHTLPAAQTLVFDPVGDDRNLSGREPEKGKEYGLDKTSTAVSQSIDVDMVKAKVPAGLPAGRVRLLERTATGTLTPLGESRIFERAGSDTEKLSPTTSVAVGRAIQIEGKRKRREYTIDEEDKRLIEEFEIDLVSTADHPMDVIVREHLYRGLNWTLAYHNVGDQVTKEGPQKIALRTTVPAKGKARVIYRVVYHW
jgi:hypothetical protein